MNTEELFDGIGGLDLEDDSIELNADGVPVDNITASTQIPESAETPTGDNQGKPDDDEDDGLIDIEDSLLKDLNGADSTEDSTNKPVNTDVDAYLNFLDNLVDSKVLKEYDKDAFLKEVEGGKNPTELIVALQKEELEAAKKEYFDGLSDEDKEVYKGKTSGVQLDELGNVNNALEYYKDITDEFIEDVKNEDTLKQIISIDLKNRGFSDDEVAEQLDIYEEKDLITTKAKSAKEKIVSTLEATKVSLFEKAEAAKQSDLEKISSYKKELKSTIETIDTIIPGIKIDSKMQEQLYKDFTEPVEYGKDKSPIDVISKVRNINPKMFDIALRYYNRIGLFNFDDKGKFTPDFSEINKNLQTKEARRIKAIISTDSFSKKENSKNTQIPNNTGLFDGID